MFYSHEVLTSRKYGVATVWLVATLGSKSTLKKVSRKAILDVDVIKACETIVEPEAPMALRLQSNLLYGVTRVYAQQCGYVLNDAQAAKDSMRLMYKVMRTSVLDVDDGNTRRADQLMLQDDPNFLPDFDLMPMDLDRRDLDLTTAEDSLRSTLSPHSSQLTSSGTDSRHDIGGLIIPPSASSFDGGPVGGGGIFSIRGDSGAGTRDVGGFFEDDLGLAIDDEGNLLMSDGPTRQPRAPLAGSERIDIGNASSIVRSAPGDGGLTRNTDGQPQNDDFLPVQDDDSMIAADAEAFPARAEEQAQRQEYQITSEETAEAPLRRRVRAALKVIPLDTTMELRNGDLARWNANYLTNMNDAIRHKTASKAAVQAKKNAEHWVLGQGDEGPLSMFQGARLLEALTGVKLTEGGVKRPRDEGDDLDEGRRAKLFNGKPSSDEVGRGFDDDGFMPMMGDDTVEQGREAPTPLDDRHLSSTMPWNQSAGSRRPTRLFSGGGHPTSASIGGAGDQLGVLGRRGSRLTSASPLVGRGAAGGDNDDFQLPGSQVDIGMIGAEEFELFGPAAQVDTQTAGQSQWQRAALDGESLHFLEFVQSSIEELYRTRAGAPMGGEEDYVLHGSIHFETLLPPVDHTHVVAAQALLHVLALGTKKMLTVEQDEAFGPITLCAMTSS